MTEISALEHFDCFSVLHLLNQNTDPGIPHQCLTFYINKGCGYLELIDKCGNRFHWLMKLNHQFCSSAHQVDQAMYYFVIIKHNVGFIC